MNQTVCDRCHKIGRFAYISWHGEWLPRGKDLCKDCFKYLFPEWKI